jgi:hypothetical protein
VSARCAICGEPVMPAGVGVSWCVDACEARVRFVYRCGLCTVAWGVPTPVEYVVDRCNRVELP